MLHNIHWPADFWYTYIISCTVKNSTESEIHSTQNGSLEHGNIYLNKNQIRTIESSIKG